MLTADLVKVRKRAGRIQPSYLGAHQRDRWLPLVERLIDVFQHHVGKPTRELDQAIKQIVQGERDQVRVGGFVKLLRDRCEFDKSSGADGPQLRAELFAHAAEVRRSLDMGQQFDRGAILQEVARRLDTTPQWIEDHLFADLPGEQPLLAFDRPTPIQLLQRYDLALAQGVLLKAVRVRIDLQPTSAARIRKLLRAIKFRRLMFSVQGTPSGGYRLVLDGPMSLFESTQRYGLQLALFLPVLVAGEGWSLQADVLWGRGKSKAVFELDDSAGLVSSHDEADSSLEELDRLVSAFGRLNTAWSVRRVAKIFHLGGKEVFVPDLVFEHPRRSPKVYLEAFGYWSREAVFQRVESLDRSMSDRFLLAVSKKLRVSSDIGTEDFPGEILVYSQAISARSVLAALERLTEPRDELFAPEG